MNEYQQEQLEGQRLVQAHLQRMPSLQLLRMIDASAGYLSFRKEVDLFLEHHCSGLCTRTCFESAKSACCGKDGIITFWADLVINALRSTPGDIDRLMEAIRLPLHQRKCIYLGSDGCLWNTPPLVCAMFLCDQVRHSILDRDRNLQNRWDDLVLQSKRFRWPDRPVLFDSLEQAFIDRGCRSPLMYLHNSPGLLRIKQKAGL